MMEKTQIWKWSWNIVGISRGQPDTLSFKLEFEVTNNVVEYKAFILGTQTTKKMNIKFLTVYGDSDLVVRKI